MRQPGWEGSLAENGYMYTYGWVPLLFTWNYCNIVSRLYPNTKLKVKRKRLHTPTAGGSGLIPGHKTLHAMWHSQNYKINTWFIVNIVTAHLILLCFAFLVCPVHKYWFFFFFYKLKEDLWQACVEQVYQWYLYNSICSLRSSLSHFGNSCSISSFFIIVILVMGICDQCSFDVTTMTRWRLRRCWHFLAIKYFNLRYVHCF